MALALPTPPPAVLTDSTLCAPGQYAVNIMVTAATLKSSEGCIPNSDLSMIAPQLNVTAGSFSRVSSPQQGLYPIWMEDLDLGCVDADTPLLFSLNNAANRDAVCVSMEMENWSKGRRAVDNRDVAKTVRVASYQDFSYQITSASTGSSLAVTVQARPAPQLTRSTWHDSTPSDSTFIAIGCLVFAATLVTFLYAVYRSSLTVLGGGSKAGAADTGDTVAMLSRNRANSSSRLPGAAAASRSGAGRSSGPDIEAKDDERASAFSL